MDDDFLEIIVDGRRLHPLSFEDYLAVREQRGLNLWGKDVIEYKGGLYWDMGAVEIREDKKD